jgi:predicted KAP-like P-loop ATPase
MQGYTDIPVDIIEKDELEVKVYIESLSEFITECSTPMTIAIQGDWGSGKTSMMNMIRQNVDSKVVSIWFNTWQYSQFEMASYLSVSLLSNFLEKIGANEKAKKLQKIAEKAKLFAKDFAVGFVDANLGGAMADHANAALNGNTEQNLAQILENLKEDIKKDVDAKLKKENKKRIVVCVDDLDRLAPEKAVELLEVLKIFMDVPNCVFVLAVDYGVITQGLIKKFGDQVGHSKGKSFFDKIIQLPFTVPTSRYDISQYIKNLLSGVVGGNVDENDIKAYREIADSSIGSNPRSLKRLFNSFILLNKVASKKDMFVDEAVKKQDKQRVLFATLCLQMAFPELYEFMIRNKEVLDADFFESMKDLESIESNELVEKFKGVLLAEKVLKENDDNKLYYGKLSNFMEVFYNSLQLDDELEDLSDEELENLKNILSFSAITANTREEVQQVQSSSREDNYVKFWSQFGEDIKGKSVLFQKNKANSIHSRWGTAGVKPGIGYSIFAQTKTASCHLQIPHFENREIFFDELIKYKEDIERESGKIWQWNRYNNKKKTGASISIELSGVNVSNSEDWKKINDFLITEINLMHKTLQPYLERINQTLKNQP